MKLHRFHMTGLSELSWLLFLVICVFFHKPVQAAIDLNEATLAQAEKKFGPDARKRLLEWQDMIRDDASYSDEEKLVKVNVFFNKFRIVSDREHWNMEDYWATPVEFIASNGGDCEDFSVAKYFTLKALGVPDKNLSLTYVNAVSLDQAHMVMSYYESPEAVPLVLDNLINEIEPAYKRADLKPVYSFNNTGLWTAKHTGKGQYVGTSDNLLIWRELLQRMARNLI